MSLADPGLGRAPARRRPAPGTSVRFRPVDLMRRLEENGRRLDRLRSEARVRVRPPRLAVVHPNIKESERYRLCKTVNYQKLSQEACSHAAQNERLPIQMAVQVLYFEQIRLRNAMNGNQDQLFFGSIHGQYPQRSGSGSISPRDNYASVRRENGELKLEVARMRMRLIDLEKDHVSIRQELVKSKSCK